MICAAHPVDRFAEETAQLLSQAARASVTCVSPRPGSLEAMVDDLEEARRGYGIERWLFWGMSGGGWLAQRYAHRYPGSLTGIIVESADACFRARLTDPTCVLSPAHPLWRAGLEAAGLFDDGAHADAAPLDDVEWVRATDAEILRRRGGPALMVAPGGVSDAMRAAIPAFWTFDARPWLASIALPTLVIAGERDPIVPARHVRAVADAIQGARYVEIAGAGHVPTSERRAEAADAVRELVRELG